ncbi:hypothetical protein H072_8897 [Dactylellina haptotyla CBS 200.50]|uniref:Beta-galactosidase n=1 Tax=Dactylellina haptotyla (strain CBS 200.50) TaxID=1284197 RepID=S8A8J5_DACHA|nr:hypothetical protein H072_8897 [Dactylellina haptotyla CBS 200.50]
MIAKIRAFSPPALLALLQLALLTVPPALNSAAASPASGDQKQKPLGGHDHHHHHITTQNRVTWDEQSLLIDGKRLFIFSGEVHPWRNPVQSLHLDVLQKLKAAGFNAVSIYFHWGAVEWERGVFRWNELFDLQPFFDAAKEAGLYIIARPGPYVNAETTGGGFPGWGNRVEGLWRKSNKNYTEAYTPFVNEFGKLIAKNEITKGGPIILVQVENEYSGFGDGHEDFEYEAELLQAFKDSGITVPTICDDAWLGGHFQSVDIYGWNSYPLGFDCSHPERWHNAPPDNFYNSYNEKIRKHGPKSILELQAGGFDGWGGAGYDACGKLIGPEFERAMYGSAVRIMNLYMAFGGTNWGQSAEPGVYTSYDYGSIIREDRRLRDKYYELKLQTQFLAVSPAYLTSKPWQLTENDQIGILKGARGIVLTVLEDTIGLHTKFYIVRQKDFSKFELKTYRIELKTSIGDISVPRTGPPLDLQARDSNILLVDYMAGPTHIIYTTAEVYSWKTIDDITYVIVYGDENEHHEAAFNVKDIKDFMSLEQEGAKWSYEIEEKILTVRFTILEDGDAQTIRFGKTILVILDREVASKTWILDTTPPTIIKGGYLIRSANIEGPKLHLKGDLVQATRLHILAPKSVTQVTFNGKDVDTQPATEGWLYVMYTPELPDINIPELSQLDWKYENSLPEISASYDDSQWTTADNTYTPNGYKPQTKEILYASDYGYHSGNLIWRGHFKATGGENEFWLDIQGGRAFGYSVWDSGVYVGFWEGDVTTSRHTSNFRLPATWKGGEKHTLTILQDHMGLEENWTAATEFFKSPRGPINYGFKGAQPKLVKWKLTGNLGGEKYIDKERGPWNEGGLYAERQGSPLDGIKEPGVAFYRSTFDLHVPEGVDYPMAIQYSNSTGSYYRSQIYINGYQFGKYVNSIGPQTSFFVPQGILNYNGTNTIAISLWAMQDAGASLKSLDLRILGKVEGGVGRVRNAPMPLWTKRSDVY